jgi:acyl carrier protein
MKLSNTEATALRDEVDDLVLETVAQHLLVGVKDVALSQHLRDDLDLDPLDLVLIALRLEDILAVEFPISALDSIESVGDLGVVLRALPRAPDRVPASRASARLLPARAHSSPRSRSVEDPR